MSIVLDGTTGITTPGLTNTGTETLVNLTTTGNTILGDASTDTLNVGNGGLIKDASGNVGVGVTPSAWNTFSSVVQLPGGAIAGIDASQVGVWQNAYYNSGYKYKSTAAATFYQQSGASHIWYNAPSGTAGTTISFTQAMTLDSSGNLGLGVTPSAWGGSNKAIDIGSLASFGYRSSNGLTLVASNLYIDNTDTFRFKANGIASLYQSLNGEHYWYYTNNNTLGANASATVNASMKLDASGNLLVGATSGSGLGSAKIYVQTSNQNGIISQQSVTGSYCYLSNALTNGGTFYHFQFNENGTARGSITSNGSTTAYNTTSDYRLKDITGPVTGAKDFIMALQPKQGTWKSDGSKFVGFLAHEFQEVSPSSVTGQKDAVDADGNPIMQAMQASSSEVMANLIALVQEQQALIQTLTDRVTALENK